METMALNNLWQYIKGLPLTSQNKKWLAGKLLSVQNANEHFNYEQLLERLDQLSSLKDDWDEEGAKAICDKTLRNVKLVLENASDVDLGHWLMFPAVNGTITFQHESLDALFSIGNSNFSFAFSSNGEVVKLVDSAPFSVSKIVEILKYMKGFADGKSDLVECGQAQNGILLLLQLKLAKLAEKNIKRILLSPFCGDRVSEPVPCRE